MTPSLLAKSQSWALQTLPANRCHSAGNLQLEGLGAGQTNAYDLYDCAALAHWFAIDSVRVVNSWPMSNNSDNNNSNSIDSLSRPDAPSPSPSSSSPSPSADMKIQPLSVNFSQKKKTHRCDRIFHVDEEKWTFFYTSFRNTPPGSCSCLAFPLWQRPLPQ